MHFLLSQKNISGVFQHICWSSYSFQDMRGPKPKFSYFNFAFSIFYEIGVVLVVIVC